MKITNLCRGGWGSACYCVTDDEGKHAVIIDPSASFPALPLTDGPIPQFEAILLTHTHYDHMLALADWRKQGIPLMVSDVDARGLYDPVYNVSEMICGTAQTFATAERILHEGDVIHFGDETLTVYLTPGHTAGSCCFYGGGCLFSGDTLFAEGGFGRCDLPGGSFSAMQSSLKRLLALPSDTRIYPGHGAPTTIANERTFHDYV